MTSLSRTVVRSFLALSAIATLDASVASRTTHGGGVTLVEPFETASARDVSSLLTIRLADLAEIDPAHPLAGDPNLQTFSFFGREDLIAAVSKHYQPTRCDPLPGKADVFGEMIARARTTSIVIVSESHERSEHRGFTGRVAARLRPLGYDTLAIEALSVPPADVSDQQQSVIKPSTLPYFDDEDGYYLGEAGFGRLGRRAKGLGYRLFAHEASHDAATASMTQHEQIAVREEAQANKLASYLRDHPTAKLLVHVGYSHAAEVPRADGARWMAARLKAKTGIDPLTVSQTTCRGGGEATRLAALPADQPPGTFDLVVDHPQARFVRGRPAWRQRAGDRLMTIPAALRPTVGWRVVEARPIGEPVASVPMDRVAIRPGEDVALSLPPGRYRLRVIDPAILKPARPASAD